MVFDDIYLIFEFIKKRIQKSSNNIYDKIDCVIKKLLNDIEPNFIPTKNIYVCYYIILFNSDKKIYFI